MQSDEHDKRRSGYSKYLRHYHIGLQFFVGVGLFTFGGIWLDRKLGTRVLFTLLGFALGFAGALRLIYAELFGDKPEPSGKQETSGEKDGSDGRDSAG